MRDGIDYEMAAGIGVLTINRPRARNSLDFAAQAAFARRLAEASGEPRLRALIITGAGNQAFVSGGDLRELAGEPDKATGERLRAGMTEALWDLEQLPVPVIAAINGDAVGGGCEILTACDLRLAAPHARLRFAQVSVGLTTGWGGTGRLVRLVGQGRATELLLLGRAITAAEAQAMGLVSRVVPAEVPVLDEARRWAQELAAMPKAALAATKQLVRAAAAGPSDALAELERTLFLSLWGEPDHVEALQAFLEKRQPQFET